MNFILADNQDITRIGLISLLKDTKVCDGMETATNKAELMQQIRLHNDAVVVLDYTLFDFGSVDNLIIVHERFPNVMWLLFSEDLNETFIRRVMIAQQSFSIVLKSATKEEITSALQCVGSGSRYICSQVSNMLLNSKPMIPHAESHDILTPTEKDVLREIAMGKTTKEIAAEKNLSFHTINSHRKNIFRKLEVNNVHEATKYAIRAGIVDMSDYYI